MNQLNHFSTYDNPIVGNFSVDMPYCYRDEKVTSLATSCMVYFRKVFSKRSVIQIRSYDTLEPFISSDDGNFPTSQPSFFLKGAIADKYYMFRSSAKEFVFVVAPKKDWDESLMLKKITKIDDASCLAMKYIRDVAKISTTELAWTFDVSPQIIDKWTNGENPDQQYIARIKKLKDAVEIWAEKEIKVSASLLRRKICDETSILESIREDGEVCKLAKKSLAILVSESNQRKQLDRHLLRAQEVDLPLTEFGLPYFNESC